MLVSVSVFFSSQTCDIYLRIFQSRTAARRELLDQAASPDECEKLYEESLWCLYALQDDLRETGNPLLEEDRTMIATCTSSVNSFILSVPLCVSPFIYLLCYFYVFITGIKRTKLRLLRCQARKAMNDRDRLSDARADQNLVDVARYPPPWELQPSDQPQVSPPLPSR